ncbi:hypothetical protein BS297_07350 [Rhodococcus erythropolis]|uniref:Uncharacterized protein n=1 Tax=Rhodococcus erythropolis TaxID=1833 RepID=A0A5N5E6I9_RHOER|nr:hypothetical protein BS297_07350 [Rhodococcus erythropolis]
MRLAYPTHPEFSFLAGATFTLVVARDDPKGQRGIPTRGAQSSAADRYEGMRPSGLSQLVGRRRFSLAEASR